MEILFPRSLKSSVQHIFLICILAALIIAEILKRKTQLNFLHPWNNFNNFKKQNARILQINNFRIYRFE